MSDFCVADLANSRAIRCNQRLEFEHFVLTAMDGGNAKGLQRQSPLTSRDGGNAKGLPGAILASAFHPELIRVSLAGAKALVRFARHAVNVFSDRDCIARYQP